MNFHTVGEQATGMADSLLSEGGIPIAVAGSLVSEGPTEMMADEVLFSGVPTGMSDTLFSDGHTDVTDSPLADVPSGRSDSLVSRVRVFSGSIGSIEIHSNRLLSCFISPSSIILLV